MEKTLDIAPPAAHIPANERLGVDLPGALKITEGVAGRSTWLELVKRGLAPQPRRVVGTRRVFWLKSEVEAWVKQQPIARGGAK